MSLQPGAFVSVQGQNIGLAKLISIEGEFASIEWFTSIAQHTAKPRLQKVFLSRLHLSTPPPQTRCYVEVPGGTWGVGRIIGDGATDGFGFSKQLRVRIGGEGEEWFPQEWVWVRCLLPGANPLETLAVGAQDTPYFHPRRHAFMRAYLGQRGAAAGLTGLLSARIKLLPHQVHVVRRVLEDPVCRYLLADEVGLGKTIEAGIIARQLRLDQPEARILVVVPSALKKQWKGELEDKFLLPVDGEGLMLLSTQELAEASPCPTDFELVIFDEAHHIGAAHRNPNQAPLWDRCRELAHAAPRLLLLSATPALGHEADFAAMLHLLEPQTYPSHDLDSFRRRVDDRQEVGQFLLSFNTPLSRLAARRALPQLRALFADDPAIIQATDELEVLVLSSAKPDPSQPQTMWQGDEANRLARLLRLQICETYRLHRRMVRTSRRTLARDGLLDQIETGKRLGATAEWDFDPRLESLHDALESWRDAARFHISHLQEEEAIERTNVLAEVYAVLWTCAATWHHLLRLAIECRLGSDDDFSDALGEGEQTTLRAPLFEGEDEALRALEGVFKVLPSVQGNEPRDALGVALSLVAQEWRANAASKVVLFTSSRLAAQTIAKRLKALRVWNARAWTHLESESEGTRDDNLSAFEKHDGPCVLLCDRSGEEGLNLQFASALILFDVPPDPNRLEQRLGRLDRIGHAHDLRPRVFAGWSGNREFGEPSSSIHEAWFRVLNDGLRLFHESVADLGFSIEAMLPRLKRIAFELGPQGLLDQVGDIQTEIERERIKIREQAELDETEAFARDDDLFFENLEARDKASESLSQGVHSWMSSAWHFRYDGRLELPRVRFCETENTLVPRDWRDRLLAAQDAVPASWPASSGGCYSRSLSCNLPSTQLLRPGSGLLDELYRLSLWDDRGQAFALWRATPLWEEDEPGLFFRFDFLIEADTKPVKQVLEELKESGWNGSGLLALMRQAESWLPPQWKSYVFDRQGRYVTDTKILEMITPDYKDFREGRDYNLDAERLWALDQVIAPNKLKELCSVIGKHTTKFVRQVSKLRQTWSQNSEKASQEAERRLELVRRGMLRGATYSPTGLSPEDVEEQLAQEKRLSDALCEGIANPSIRIDAAGLYVLSRDNPFVGGHNPAFSHVVVETTSEASSFDSSAQSFPGLENVNLPFDLLLPEAALVDAIAPEVEAVSVATSEENLFETEASLLLDRAVEAGIITLRKHENLFSYYKDIFTGVTSHRANGNSVAVLDLLRRSLEAKGTDT